MISRFLPIYLLALSIALFFLACDQKPVDVSPVSEEIPWTQIDAFPRVSYVTDVWGTGPDDVYVGHYGNGEQVLQRFDGQTWTWVSLQGVRGVYDIWSSGPNDVYVATNQDVKHFDGIAWSDTGIRGHSIVGTSPQEMYVIDSRAIHHFNGADWDTIRTFADYEYSSAAWALPGGELVVVKSEYPAPDSLLWWSGSTWTAEEAPGDVFGLWGLASNDLIAVGHDPLVATGAIWRWDGSQWNPMPLPVQVNVIRDVMGVSASEVYAGTCCTGTLLKFDGASWQSEDLPAADNLDRVWASGPSDVYVTVDGTSLLHGDGAAWTNALEPKPRNAELVWAESPQRLVVVGNRSVYRFDHGVWTEEDLGDFGSGYSAIVGSGWDDLYISSNYGGIIHFDGTQWSLMSDESTNDLSMTPDGHLFAIGYETFSIFDGATWTQPAKVDDLLVAVWAAAANYAILVGANSLWKYDGSTMQPVFDADGRMKDVWGVSAGEAYIAADYGIVRYDGVSITYFGPPDGRLQRITGTSSDHIIAVGYPSTFFKDGAFWKASASSVNEGYLDLVPAKDGSIVRLVMNPQSEIVSLSYHRP